MSQQVQYGQPKNPAYWSPEVLHSASILLSKGKRSFNILCIDEVVLGQSLKPKTDRLAHVVS